MEQDNVYDTLMLVMSKNLKYKILLYILFLFVLPSKTYAKSNVAYITISTQNDIASYRTKIADALSTKPDKIIVSFKEGTYFYKDSELQVRYGRGAGVNLEIRGNGSYLIAEGKSYHDGDQFVGTFNTELSVIDIKNKNDLSLWGNVYLSENRVEVIDKTKKLCRVKCSSLTDKSPTECKDGHILLTSWFVSYVSKVEYIKAGYVYFTPKELNIKSGYKDYDIDFDYVYGGMNPRFKLCNVYDNAPFSIIDNHVNLSSKQESAYVCTAGTAFRFYATVLKSISISGFNFLGSSLTADSKGVIEIDYCNCESIEISHCTIAASQNTAIYATNSDNVIVHDNKISYIYKGGIQADNKCNHVRIYNNELSYIGLRLLNTSAIDVKGQDYRVAYNKISNFGYSALNIGIWGPIVNQTPPSPSGVVEHNEIYMTPEYVADIANHGLMDSGAIYVGTQNNRSTIQYNYIHDIAGIKNNRGIFCDGGARNVSIIGNVITHVANSYCIDSYRVASFENIIGPSNVGVVISDNIVDGKIRFEGREGGDNGCLISSNYDLVTKDEGELIHTIKNVQVEKDNIKLKGTGLKKDRVGVDPASYRLLKKAGTLKELKSFLIKKRK